MKVTSPAHWSSVKVTFIKSMCTGIFFNRKYWARYSKSGGVLKPVYFSSIIMGDKAQHLNNCALKFRCKFAEALSVLHWGRGYVRNVAPFTHFSLFFSLSLALTHILLL
jgi:hypothetical protein